MVRKELYERLRVVLPHHMNGLRHIDLWNRNVEFIEQEDGWEMPAVFVELMPVSWTTFKDRVYRGEGLVRLHVVTEWHSGGQEEAWRLSDSMCRGVEGLRGDGFVFQGLVETLTNHDHEDVLETIEVFRVCYQRDTELPLPF